MHSHCVVSWYHREFVETSSIQDRDVPCDESVERRWLLRTFLIKMPRVVENQRAKFDTDPILRQLQEENEIRYADYLDCGVEERRLRFRTECHEGKCKLGFVTNGVHLLLSFPKVAESRYVSSEFVDFGREMGKVYIKCPLILNGVCVRFLGCLDLQTLAGVGHLEFDEASAPAEHRLMVETLRSMNQHE